MAEIEPFPCAALAHHYPGVPNLGDVTQITEAQIKALGHIDLVVGGFPCFPKGTLILTRQGLVDISDIKEGDEVLTHLNRWKKVIRHHGSHKAPTITMRGHGHPCVITTSNHPFLFSKKTSKSTMVNGKSTRLTSVSSPEWISASEMKGKFWASPTRFPEEAIDLPSFIKDKEVFFWVVGRWLADGWAVTYKRKSPIPQGNRGSRINTFARRVHWCALKKEADYLFMQLEKAGINTTRVSERTVDKFVVQSVELAEFLTPFGKGASGKTIPTWILTAPEEMRAAFLDGYVTGDGGKHGLGWKATTVSKNIAVGIRLLAISLGWSVALHFFKRPIQCVIEGRLVNQKDTWQVVAVPQKVGSSSFETADGYRFGLVRDVHETGIIQEVFNFEVEEDNSYVADGLVVHNCQDLSIAGQRKGLKNEDGTATRSGLFFEAMRIVEWAGPRWLVIENVPGMFSSQQGRDFAAVVGEMAGAEFGVPRDGWRNTGVALGPLGLVEWATLDAQFFGVPQRRRRVFLVRDSGDWTRRPPVLLERESLLGNPKTRRKTGKGVAGTIAAGAPSRRNGGGRPADGHCQVAPTLSARTKGGGGLGTDFDLDGGLTLARCDTTGEGRRQDAECGLLVAHSLRAEGFDASEDGTGRGTPLVPVTCGSMRANGDAHSGFEHGDGLVPIAVNGMNPSPVAPTLDKGKAEGMAVFAIQERASAGPNCGPDGKGFREDVGYTLEARNKVQAVAFAQNQRDEARTMDIAGALAAEPGMKQQTYVTASAVRRLTARECARLQGFPDDYLDITFRGKPAADGNKYKALGNSMAVPVMAWIGRRIALVESLTASGAGETAA